MTDGGWDHLTQRHSLVLSVVGHRDGAPRALAP